MSHVKILSLLQKHVLSVIWVRISSSAARWPPAHCVIEILLAGSVLYIGMKIRDLEAGVALFLNPSAVSNISGRKEFCSLAGWFCYAWF